MLLLVDNDQADFLTLIDFDNPAHGADDDVDRAFLKALRVALAGCWNQP
jgi:hypothetical protein